MATTRTQAALPLEVTDFLLGIHRGAEDLGALHAAGYAYDEFLEFDLDRLSAEEIDLLRTEYGDLLRAEARRRGIVPSRRGSVMASVRRDVRDSLPEAVAYLLRTGELAPRGTEGRAQAFRLKGPNAPGHLEALWREHRAVLLVQWEREHGSDFTPWALPEFDEEIGS